MLHLRVQCLAKGRFHMRTGGPQLPLQQAHRQNVPGDIHWTTFKLLLQTETLGSFSVWFSKRSATITCSQRKLQKIMHLRAAQLAQRLKDLGPQVLI